MRKRKTYRIFNFSEGGGRYSSEVAVALEQHGAPVWRVCWNVTGTLLATSGDDATVRLWKSNYNL